jgi:DNA-binding PadR family transcriptional regulator
MEREGPVYGYLLSERIADRTDGGWRPGAGAIYPALQSLVERGLARPSVDGRRRVYRATPSGRAFLRRLRANYTGRRRGGPDLSTLWSEIVGGEDAGPALLDHLHYHLENITQFLERRSESGPGTRELIEQLRGELRATDARVASLAGARTRRRRGRPA